jgi:HEAT repeat protein
MDEESPTLLLETLRTSKSIDDVRHAAIRLGDEGVGEAFGPLVELLGGEHPVLRDAAALALRDLRDQRALQPLTQAIQREPHRCSTYIYALQPLDCRPIVEFLVDLYIQAAPATRSSISGCLDALDPASLPDEPLQRVRNKLRDAAQSAESDADREQLSWLLALLHP